MPPRILILHDYFLYRGGGERLVISLAKGLGADIATAFIAKDAFDPRAEGIKTIELYKEKAWSRLPGFRYLQVQLSFLLKTDFIKNYDVVIYSGDCLTAVVRAKGRKNIAYMHTPPRHLYDAYSERLREYPLWKKIIFIPFVRFNRWRFKALSKRLDLIVTNSKNTQQRIKQYLGLDSVVVYPPCDTLPFKNLLTKEDSFESQNASPRLGGVGVGSSKLATLANPPPALGPTPPRAGSVNGQSIIQKSHYFFSWARLAKVKRVDYIVKAFCRLPNKKLIVASNGSELDHLRELAKDCPNIQILGWISDNDLLKYLGNCLATIYIPIREDFGMSAVESMGAGKPVIGAAEGGLLEIIKPGENGLLLPENFTVSDLAAAVESLTPERAKAMEQACYATARNFTEERFISAMRAIVEKTAV